MAQSPRPFLVVAVVGPTATGKSALGVALAHALGGDVVNADSMQLYRGMDVGTDKLPIAERQGVAHHLLDIWSVTEPASVAVYQQLARAELDALRVAGRPAILVGGSGLYVRAVLDDLRFPGTSPELRARLELELAAVGPAVLHARLAALDPRAAARIQEGNGRRIVRALEVLELTGDHFQASLPDYRYLYPTVQIGLDLPDVELDTRIAARVDRMWQRGLLAEVRVLEESGLRRGPTASRALGYAQVLAHLAGAISEAEARAETERATRRFARRQRSWFRRDQRVLWLPGGSRDSLPRALAAVEEVCRIAGG